MKRFLLRCAIVLAPLLLLTLIAAPKLGPWLVVDDPLRKADVIYVLGGTLYERPLEAVDLYRDGWAPRVMLVRQIPDSGEEELKQRGVPYVREIDLQIEVLGRLGVPRSAIDVLEPANSTADEADHLYDVATARQLTSVIVVTSKQHTRRARLVMNRRLAGTGISVTMRYSRYDRSDVDRWWASRGTLRFTLFETQRLIAYWTGIAD